MITVKLQELNKKNLNGRIYPTAVVEKAIESAKERIENGNFWGTLGVPQGPSIPLDLISHRVLALRIEGDYLVGDVKILDTPMARTYQEIEESKLYSVTWRPMGTGKVDNDGVITDYNIMGITAIPATDAA